MKRERIQEGLDREEEAAFLDSGKWSSHTHWSLSFRVHIYSRLEKAWGLFLDNPLIKTCQSCLNVKRFMALVILGKEIFLHQIYEAGSKPKLKHSFSNPCGKTIHLRRVGKSIFIIFIQPTLRFLFSHWTSAVSFMVLNKLTVSAVWNFPLVPEWLTQHHGKKRFCTAVGGAS